MVTFEEHIANYNFKVSFEKKKKKFSLRKYTVVKTTYMVRSTP